MRGGWWLAVLLALLDSGLGRLADTYDEELVLRRLPSNHLAAVFRFRMQTAELGGHYNLFPSQLGLLLERNGLQEVHMSLARGHWRQSVWGYPPASVVPVGAQLWAWFEPGMHSVDHRWSNTINVLGGMFCGGFRQAIPTFSSAPQLAYRPWGVLRNASASAVRHSTVPSENVCTENLTPWKKLLPCKRHGLVSLLNPIVLAESHYHSLSYAVDATRVCADGETSGSCARPVWRLDLQLTAVLDHQWQMHDWKYDFTLRQLFGVPLESTCALAGQHSAIILEHQPTVFSELSVSHSADRVEVLQSKAAPGVPQLVQQVYSMRQSVANYTADGLPFLLQANYAPGMPDFRYPINAVPVSLHTYLSGTGNHLGAVVSSMENRLAVPVPAIYSHVLPWYMRVFLHTLLFTCQAIDGGGASRSYKLDKQYFVASRDRERPAALELRLTLPARSSCTLSHEFDKAFLRNTEYPPDANHGFHVPSPELQLLLDRDDALPAMLAQHTPLAATQLKGTAQKTSSESVVVRLYGEPLLVVLATPDFSMPYNVICMVCTVIALAFGPTHNITTKTCIGELQQPASKAASAADDGWRARLRRWLADLASRVTALFRRNADSVAPVTEPSSDEIDKCAATTAAAD